MKLSKYDNKLVRLKSGNKIYEGYAVYDSIEFNECEYGRVEESISLLCFKYYKSDIEKIELIDKYTEDYSDLEKELIESDYDLIEEAVEIGENLEIERLKKYFYKTIAGKEELTHEKIKIKDLFDKI